MRAGFLDNAAGEGFKLCPGDAEQEAKVGREEGELHFRLHVGAEANLGRFGGFSDARDQRLLGRGGLLEIGAARLGDLGDKEVGQRAVEIIAAQSGVSMGGQDLKDAVVELENGKVEGAATQVVHRDLGVLLELVETVGERRRRRLVDDALDLESGQFSGP